MKILAERGVTLIISRAYEDDVRDIRDFDMAFFGGAPLDPNVQDFATLGQIEQIRVGLSRGIPMLGICRGFQLLVLAAGGDVVLAPKKEEGMYDEEGVPFTVHLTSEGREDPLFRGLGANWFRVFHMHKMMCDLKNIPESVLLATGRQEYCHVQIARIGSMYGFQSHIEFDIAMMEHFTLRVPDFQALGDTLMSDFERFYEEYYAVTQRLINNFLDIAETY